MCFPGTKTRSLATYQNLTHTVVSIEYKCKYSFYYTITCSISIRDGQCLRRRLITRMAGCDTYSFQRNLNVGQNQCMRCIILPFILFDVIHTKDMAIVLFWESKVVPLFDMGASPMHENSHGQPQQYCASLSFLSLSL